MFEHLWFVKVPNVIHCLMDRIFCLITTQVLCLELWEVVAHAEAFVVKCLSVLFKI